MLAMAHTWANKVNESNSVTVALIHSLLQKLSQSTKVHYAYTLTLNIYANY